jgi:hypothetical protein
MLRRSLAFWVAFGVWGACTQPAPATQQGFPQAGTGVQPAMPGDSSTPPPEGGSGDETAPPAPDGGTTGTGMNAGGDAPEPVVLPGTAEACPDATFLELESLGLPACEHCPNARCIPTSLVSSMNPETADRLGACGDGDNKCVPDAYAITGGKVTLKRCTSLLGGEGRCVSVCIPLVAEQGDALPQDVCADDERCTPCFDPFSGEDTGACALGCTEPPTSEPATFEKCCSGTGSCVPRALAGDRADQLNADSCSDTSGDTLCAPDDIARDRPATCRSINDNEGRCLSRCLNTVKEQEASLPQSTCPETHLCVPCFNPRSDDEESTGACEINGDEPTEPGKPFSPCCGGEARCVPRDSVPEARRANLTQMDCAAGNLCTPRAAVANPDGGAFAGNPTCMTDLSGLAGLAGDGQPGICAPLCFQPAPQPVVGGQPLRGTCASSSQFCAPCTHPTENTSTGACP